MSVGVSVSVGRWRAGGEQVAGRWRAGGEQAGKQAGEQAGEWAGEQAGERAVIAKIFCYCLTIAFAFIAD